MAILATGKIDGNITVTGSGTQGGAASLTIKCKIIANYDQTNLTDFTIYNDTETKTSTVNNDGKLNGGSGVVYTLNHSATDTATGIKYTVAGKWTINATGNTMTITKNSFTTTTEKV